MGAQTRDTEEYTASRVGAVVYTGAVPGGATWVHVPGCIYHMGAYPYFDIF